MLSNEEARHLLRMKKHIDGNNKIDLSHERMRLSLVSDEDNYKFILDIHLNKKIQFKLSLHHQEDLRKIGLLRLDYKGRHTNPSEANDNLPNEFEPFIGKCFGIDEPHIHCYVAGYKPLAWALPVAEYGFSVTEAVNYTQYQDAISNFVSEIQIVDKIEMQGSLI